MLKTTTVLLGLVLAIVAGPSDPWPNPDPNWVETHERFVNNTLANPGIPVLFYGDSIMRRWADDPPSGGRPIFDQLYAALGVTNYGIGGEIIQGLLWRVLNGEVQGLSPKLVVLKIGTNNLGGYDTNVEVADGIATLVRTLRQLLPNTKILLLGILPRNGVDSNGDVLFDRVVDVNNRIAWLHNGSSVFFLDMFANFVETWGSVPSSLFNDGLHLTTDGYQKWADVMGPLFNQLVA